MIFELVNPGKMIYCELISFFFNDHIPELAATPIFFFTAGNYIAWLLNKAKRAEQNRVLYMTEKRKRNYGGQKG